MNDIDYNFLDELDESFQTYDEIYSSDNWSESEAIEPVMTLQDLYQLCIEPNVKEGISHAAILLIWGLIFRLSTQIVKIPLIICHILSAGTGLIVMHHFFQTSIIFILIFTTGSYLILNIISHLIKKHRGYLMSIICIIFLIICELFIVHSTTWHMIRGAQMLIAMKVISLAFDMDFGILQTIPNGFEFLGYVLSVGNSVFGPWVSYKDYLLIYYKSQWDLSWFWKIISNLFLAMLFLTISSCWLEWLIGDNSWRWSLAYRDAFSFRSSHYFISYLSTAAFIISGYGWHISGKWDYNVSKPFYIEMPRSLVQVVIYWNIPMHNWLKNYIFRTTKPLGSFVAILCTYAMSSLLHGINFQLAAVLLSLGVYTYVEYILRQKLASIFSACILVRPCRKDCGHKYGEKHVMVLLVNIVLGMLVMFHLAYLGLMFDSSSKLQEEGYNYIHTLSKWTSLKYASHWLILGTYIFYLLI